MTNEEKIKEFRRIVDEMANLYEKKNSNYGDSFGQLYDKLGPIAGLVPLHNKLDRATNLITGGKNNFESLEDTFKDLACYAIMNLIELNNNKKVNNTDTTVGDLDERFIHTFCEHCAYYNGSSEEYCTWALTGRGRCKDYQGIKQRS